MATKKGITTLIEDAAAEVLQSLEYDGAKVFKKAESFQFQLTSLIESLDRDAPLAYVECFSSVPTREGGHDLSQVLDIEIVYGCTSVSDGDARRGTDGKLGGSKIRDLIIEALEGWHPGEGFDCDEFYLTDSIELVGMPKKYVGGLTFSARRNSASA